MCSTADQSQSLQHMMLHPGWYKACPVGKNKLGSMVSEKCVEAGILQKTNHSLHAIQVLVKTQLSIIM